MNFNIDKYSHIGNRLTNDDYIYIDDNKHYLLCMVIDGHGGYECVNMFINLFKNIFKHNNVSDNIKKYITDIFNKINTIILNNKINSGLCVSGIYIRNNYTISFQLGDTKIYIYNNNKLIFESIQHDMTNYNEVNRCYKHIKNVDVPRLYGKLTITRALGNYDIPNLSYTPEIDFIYDKYDKIIMCSDGIYKKINIDPKLSARDNINKCLLKPPNDNMSILILKKNDILNLINNIR